MQPSIVFGVLEFVFEKILDDFVLINQFLVVPKSDQVF